MDVVEHSPPHLVQAIGSRVWSEDGGEYVDYDNAGGAVLLGHRDPAVIAAMRMARSSDERRGQARYEKDVADRIAELAPGAEACAFGGEVSQALRAAAAAARLHTGRDQVFVCRGAEAAGSSRRPAGPTFPFDDLAALERLTALHDEDAAALVLAPGAGRAPSAGYLEGVRALCDRIGAVLVFDETASGFRVHEGGAQGLFGVRADLLVFGPSLANGMPLGVLAGRRELVAAAQGADPLKADIAALAAAKAVLGRIKDEPVIAALRAGGMVIRVQTQDRLAEAGLERMIEIGGDAAAGRLIFHGEGGVDPATVKAMWINACFAHRLFTLGSVNMSYAHGDREVAALLAAFDQAADRLAAALGRGVSQPRPSAAQSYG
jgi:glutamate-1-semialdehyde aminotransferase